MRMRHEQLVKLTIDVGTLLNIEIKLCGSSEEAQESAIKGKISRMEGNRTNVPTEAKNCESRAQMLKLQAGTHTGSHS